MFLLIQNEGVAPIEAFTMLGDSGTRHRAVQGLIGQFGSGTKHAINLLLRKGIEFHIYSGKTRLEFYVEPTYVTEADGTSRQSFPVKCRLSGGQNRTIDCGWTAEFGALDWTKTSMALREFVSNAIDCSKIMDTQPLVAVEANRRAKEGYTRIFVSLRDPEVSEFHRELGKHFLHFSADPSQVEQTFLRKNPDSIGPRIYREGVLVSELRSEVRAAFDYNFKNGEIKIDECRNSDEYTLRARIAQLINKANKNTLAVLFELMAKGDVYESSLDDYYLGYGSDEETKQNWTDAWQSFAGEAVIAGETLAESKIAEHIEAKGHRVIAVKSKAFVSVAEKMGVRNMAAVLGQHGAQGRIECPATP
ncbi:MAG: hypothetical protein MN733_39905, partial [Nitrososphaera sp.]|nr:hypothetical protein [Nitrososphaera sp.]